MAKQSDGARRASMAASVGAGQGDHRPDGATAGATLNDRRFAGTTPIREARAIPRERIAPDPDQPRKEFDDRALLKLAFSMKDRGQLQPIRVQWRADMGLFLIVAGERRWRAAELAEMPTLLCLMVEDTLGDDDRLLMQLEENCVRDDLKPIEQARAFRKLQAARGWTTAELAETVHVAESQVVKALALLRLPGEVQDQVEAGTLAPSTANEIERIPDPADQVELAREAVEQNLTREEVTQRARQKRGGKSRRGRTRVPRPDTWSTTVRGNAVTVVGPAAAAGVPALDSLFRQLLDELDQGEPQENAA